ESISVTVNGERRRLDSEGRLAVSAPDGTAIAVHLESTELELSPTELAATAHGGAVSSAGIFAAKRGTVRESGQAVTLGFPADGPFACVGFALGYDFSFHSFARRTECPEGYGALEVNDGQLLTCCRLPPGMLVAARTTWETSMRCPSGAIATGISGASK